jgi:hypothetical protein
MSKEKIQQMSFVSPGTTASQRGEPLDQTDVYSPFACLTRNRRNSGPTNVKHYLLVGGNGI